jgi:hypothetical protein
MFPYLTMIEGSELCAQTFKQRTYYIIGKMLVGKELKAVSDINLYCPADFEKPALTHVLGALWKTDG